jgi:sarcosine oxidase
VIGLGSMGASALCHLADRGLRVLGIDRFHPPHTMGSHGGQSRIIRKAYFEHPDYIPLLQKAYDSWKHLEARSGERIYLETGVLYAASKGHPLLRQIEHSASLYDIPLASLSPLEASGRFPPFSFPPHFEVLFEPEAGLIRPEVAISAFLKEARRAGANIHPDEKVMEWKPMGEGVEVKTDKSTYHARRMVLAAGPWTMNLLPAAKPHLNVTRQVLAWYDPIDSGLFKPGKFPCWFIAEEGDSGAYYGFPILPKEMGGPQGLKLAYHHPGRSTSADAVDRNIVAEDVQHLETILRKYLPASAPRLSEASTCLYSNTPDEHFVIDLLPGMEDRVCMAWGFSGHGFKFVSVVGEILADLATEGRTDHPIGFLSASRFSG